MAIIESAIVGGSALQAISQVFSHLRDGKNTVGGIAKHFGNGSLVQIAQQFRVEPILLVDTDVALLDWMSDLAGALHANFTAYYLQAVDAMGQVGGVSVGAKLAPLSPNRSITLLDRDCVTLNMENYKYSLPSPHKKPHPVPTVHITQEASNPNNESKLSTGSRLSTDAKAGDNLRDNAGMSVGKIITVTLCEGQQQASVKIAIRLLAKNVSSRVLVDMMSFKNHFNTSMKERWESVKLGDMSFVEFILMGDLIKASRNTQIRDKSGIFTEIQQRASKNFKAGLISRAPSLNTASNLAIISTETAQMLEMKLGGPLDSLKMREIVFNNSQLMILAVVDKEWERVKFYHNGMSTILEVDRRDLKASGKKEGAEIVEMMKAFMAGKPGI